MSYIIAVVVYLQHSFDRTSFFCIFFSIKSKSDKLRCVALPHKLSAVIFTSIKHASADNRSLRHLFILNTIIRGASCRVAPAALSRAPNHGPLSAPFNQLSSVTIPLPYNSPSVYLTNFISTAIRLNLHLTKCQFNLVIKYGKAQSV